MDAISILDEMPTDLGLALWRSARNVLLWAETPHSSRGELFTGNAGAGRVQLLAHLDAEPELRAPLLVIADLLAHPATADLLRVVNACRRIALWAESRGALATALEFTQAAALSSPDSASLAFGVGRLARRLADYDRAESWYTRAVVQAREHQDWRSYASALAGIGNLHRQKGNYPAAKRTHLRCLKAATRHHVQDLIGAAYHNLFSIEIELEAGLEADVLAAHALAAYATPGPAVYRLAYDVAFHWMLRGYYSGALAVARAVEPVIAEVGLSPLLEAVKARVAAGMGDRAAYEMAAERIDDLLSDPTIPEDTAARTLLGLAHAALSIGDARSAVSYASEAVSIARKRSEGAVVLEAEAALDAASRSVVRPVKRGTAADTSAPTLADDFVRALAAPRTSQLVGQ
ncbi:MAG TPA: tetratricopeptide repeat protein [Longimicrobium sp.]|nr:tetratricopeptide repeat protein [Longimicrobium sp.]